MNTTDFTRAILFRITAACLLSSLLASPAVAGVTADQTARLGVDLTPLGGERAGNAEGSIPPWTGGITEPPAGYQVGEHHRDPFSAGPAVVCH